MALLHADSWRRNYRGAYAASFLDGDVVANRRKVWSSRLAHPAGSATVLAEDGTGLVGFVHVVFDEDERWGSLIDNLHVSHDRRRTGIGTALLSRAAEAVVEQAVAEQAVAEQAVAERAVAELAVASPVHLWVLEQNLAAQRFYLARGGRFAEKAAVAPPGGVPERLDGSPVKLRFVWPDAAALVGNAAATAE